MMCEQIVFITLFGWAMNCYCSSPERTVRALVEPFLKLTTMFHSIPIHGLLLLFLLIGGPLPFTAHAFDFFNPAPAPTAQEPPISWFDLDVYYTTTAGYEPSDRVKNAFAATKTQWEKVIIGDLPFVNTSVTMTIPPSGNDGECTVGATVNDIVVCVSERDFGINIVAEAASYEKRTAAPGLPYIGRISFNSQALPQDDVVLEDAFVR